MRVWDTNTGQLLRTLQGHTNTVNAVALSRDGQRIVSGSSDSTVRVWDANTGQLLRTLQGHTRAVNTVALSRDGQRIVSGSDDESVRVWDANTGQLLRTLQGHTEGVCRVAISRDGQRIVSRDRYGKVLVWSAATASWWRTRTRRASWRSASWAGPALANGGTTVTVARADEGSPAAGFTFDASIILEDARMVSADGSLVAGGRRVGDDALSTVGAARCVGGGRAGARPLAHTRVPLGPRSQPHGFASQRSLSGGGDGDSPTGGYISERASRVVEGFGRHRICVGRTARRRFQLPSHSDALCGPSARLPLLLQIDSCYASALGAAPPGGAHDCCEPTRLSGPRSNLSARAAATLCLPQPALRPTICP